MTRPKSIGLATGILFGALWVLPLARAISFFLWAKQYFAEDGSIDASNDLLFSKLLLASYFVSLLAGVGLAWLISRRPGLAFLAPIGFLLFAVIEVLWIRPEAPIVFFPAMLPWRPAFICVSAVLIAAAFTYFPPRESDQRNA
jgi:hypothetical protein